ncbi:MAG TPA: hypothetical protein PKI20_14185 [Verrucomicrobiota bacterium]|jgi:hypothetical protein|nr:hypothetical protein [Verrucomicrobiota bacterium]HQL78842.1 hypothetical protein [Verrucomicrobiota bacterium]
MKPLANPIRKALIPIWEKDRAMEVPILHLPRRRPAGTFRTRPLSRLWLRGSLNSVNQTNQPGAPRAYKPFHAKHCTPAS